jgi:5-methylcytosine-specific restriction endonuclease McrA
MRRVLILTQSWEAHRIVGWEKAVCMLFDGKAEVVDEFDEELRSPSLTMKMPAVIRMTRKTRIKKTSIKFSRENVLTRDGFQCQYCLAEFSRDELTYDHVLPRSRGGKTCWENIVAACYGCNSKKGNRTPDEAGMPLRRTPRKPAWLPVTTKRFNVVRMPEQWRPFIQQAA